MLLGHTPGESRFERWAPRYDRSPLQALYFRPLHRRIVRLLSPAGGGRLGHVLDVGSGTGNLSLRLASIADRVTGVDPSPSMLDVSVHKDLPASVREVAGAAEALPFPDATFDAAVSCVSAHHWADPSTAFAEIARVLKPGAPLVLADMRRLDPLRVRIQRRRHPGHHEGWHRGELADLASRAGFEPASETGAGWLSPFAVILRARSREDR
jgi:ubiquinone/menaquinone biosynthesis C-methylase UbiE